MALLCRLHAATEGPFIIPLQTPVLVYHSWWNYISDIQALFAIPKVAGQLQKICTPFVTFAKNILARERWIYTCYRLLSLAKTLLRLRSWFLLVTCYSLIVTLPIMGTADSIEISQWSTAQPLLQIKYQFTKNLLLATPTDMCMKTPVTDWLADASKSVTTTSRKSSPTTVFMLCVYIVCMLD